ncbi:hypothetical protein Tco_0560658 [Tanacetum coccineum]
MMIGEASGLGLELLSQLEAHGAEVSNEDANHKFLRALPSAWSNLAMTMRTKPEIDTLSIDDLYNNLRVFEQESKVHQRHLHSALKMLLLFRKAGVATNKVKLVLLVRFSTCKYFYFFFQYSEDEAPAVFVMKELHIKRGTNDGKKKTDSVYQDQEAGKQELKSDRFADYG